LSDLTKPRLQEGYFAHRKLDFFVSGKIKDTELVGSWIIEFWRITNMIGIWKSYNDVYLIIAGVAMLVGFGLPLMLVPMGWARVFCWEVPAPRNLVIFLGRSVGVFISIIAIFAFKAAQNPLEKPFYFDLMLWLFGGMILLHAYGAIRKTQPITENLEILLWVLLGLVTLCFYPI
jgi:hypothetical protein